VVFNNKDGMLGRVNLGSLQGKHLGISGEVKLHKGKPQIILGDEGQIDVMIEPGFSRNHHEQ